VDAEAIRNAPKFTTIVEARQMDIAQGLNATSIKVATAAIVPESQASDGAPDRAQLGELVRTLYREHLLRDRAVDPTHASHRARFAAFARAVRDLIAPHWASTREAYTRLNPKSVYYLSMEFLIGRSLGNNLMNLLLDAPPPSIVGEEDLDWICLLEQEPDAGLGNGGLGRLAACYLDSLATLAFPAVGYGLRYEYGIFKQTIRDGWQEETPDNWLRQPDPWEIVRPDEAVEVKLGCSLELREGHVRPVRGRASTLIGIPYDRPVVGYGGKAINTLRLWGAAASDFDLKRFNAGDFIGALSDSIRAELLTRVLYPDDSTVYGQDLRFVQEYFLVACSLGDLTRSFRSTGSDWHLLPEKAAIQLNDTHPALAVPELMRILLDEGHLDWEIAWDITQRTLGYTNHTLLPEALEKWPIPLFELVVPRLLEIIYEINRRFLDSLRARGTADDAQLARVSLIEEGPEKRVRMAHLAILGSHSTNGVAKIHSELLRTKTVRDLAELFPDRFNNKTNGVTPRRWLRLANPPLSCLITDAIGDAWVTDLSQLRRLEPLTRDPGMRRSFLAAKRAAKAQFAAWLRRTSGVAVDPDTIFDCQIKRIHGYKRQFLNTLRIIVLYNRLRANPGLEMPPRTCFFAGKAAPAYVLAKLVIKLINNVAARIDSDDAVHGRLKVLFLPEYDVSLAERLIPAADLSNQISTAGYEASGTSNMKFMMNGALTIGTRDGATIEMAEEAGEENFFLFGLTAQQVADSRGWYNPQWHYDNEPETRAALDLVFGDYFSHQEPGVFEPLREALLTHGDYYMNLADLRSYLDADMRAVQLYSDAAAWGHKAMLNVAASGKFSSDRSIEQYAREIWHVRGCGVA
jgi:glycogen phosphorylase